MNTKKAEPQKLTFLSEFSRDLSEFLVGYRILGRHNFDLLPEDHQAIIGKKSVEDPLIHAKKSLTDLIKETQPEVLKERGTQKFIRSLIWGIGLPTFLNYNVQDLSTNFPESYNYLESIKFIPGALYLTTSIRDRVKAIYLENKLKKE